MAAELPNTDNKDVMRMAVAWAIVEADFQRNKTTFHDHAALTQAFITTYNAIDENEHKKPGASSRPTG